MPNKASAKKRLRQTVKKTTENKNRKTRIKTFVKKVEQAIVQGDQAVANQVLKSPIATGKLCMLWVQFVHDSGTGCNFSK